MKEAIFTAPRAIELRDVPPPALCPERNVLLRIERLGVCGSDVHYYTDGRIGDQVLQFPATLGHECAGRVAEVGPGVTHVRPGDLVAVDPAFSCGRCDQCQAGRPHTCRHLLFMGSAGEELGAAAEYRVVPAENCFALTPERTADEAALVEPLSIGLYAVRLAQLPASATAAVLGCGPIGLSVLLCARAVHADCVLYAADLLADRAARAVEAGACWAGTPPHQDVVREIHDRQPQGLDAVFECSGDPACLDQAMALLRPGGRLVMVGIPQARRVELDVHAMRRKELTLVNVRRQNGCVGAVIELMAAGRLDARSLATHHFPFEGIAAAFELVAGYRDGVIKAMVEI